MDHIDSKSIQPGETPGFPANYFTGKELRLKQGR